MTDKTTVLGRTLRVAACIVLSTAACAAADGVRAISRTELLERVRGGWAGQMVGVSLATHTEFAATDTPYLAPLPWDVPSSVTYAHTQDDLYVEMAFVKVLDEKGLKATPRDFARAFELSPFVLYHANFVGRKNILAGILPPLSGSPEYNPHFADIDFMIESDFIGLMCPGMPTVARDLCQRVGQVMCHGEGVYGGIFVAAMYSEAFFTTDPLKVVEAGLKAVPHGCRLARCVREIIALHGAHPKDWIEAWSSFSARWVKRDICPDFATSRIDISAPANAALVTLALLYGESDFERSVSLAARCGHDSDCNAATVGGIVGTMHGMGVIPPEWRREFEKVRPNRFSWSEHTFDSVCASTLRHAEKAAQSIGGGFRGDTLRIPGRKPASLPVGSFDGVNTRIFVTAADPAFGWEGQWIPSAQGRVSSGTASSVALAFEGTGAVLHFLGGREFGVAEIRVDGQAAGNFDGYRPYGNPETQYFLGAIKLKPGYHTLEAVCTGRSSPGATGAAVGVLGAHILEDGPAPQSEPSVGRRGTNPSVKGSGS